jgi:deoxyribonuclease V
MRRVKTDPDWPDMLRTRERAKPLFISIGHRVDLDSARELALACVGRYRIPEPTRQADIEVGRLKRTAGLTT